MLVQPVPPDEVDAGGPALLDLLDLVLLDPPYGLDPDGDLVALADGDWLADGAVVVVEKSVRAPDPAYPDGFTDVTSRRYGETVVWYGTWDADARRLDA